MDLVKRKGGRSRIQRHVKHHHLDLLYARAALKTRSRGPKKDELHIITFISCSDV